MSHTARSLLLLIALFSLCSCGGEPQEARAGRAALVNGALDAGDPAVVAIVYRLPASHAPGSMALCTGVLLANRVVVTAAHCVAEAHHGPFDVFFGSELAHGGEVIPIETISVHPGYDADTHAFDVALVRIAWDARVAPLEIASDAAD
jgi:secreted trypsin-like serine protease